MIKYLTSNLCLMVKKEPKKLSTVLSLQEYYRIRKSLEDKIKELEPQKDDSIEYMDYNNILKKVNAIIAKREQAEQSDDEYKNTRSKNKWECTSCGQVVKIAMVKQCTVCQQSGDNIRQVLLDDELEDDENKEEESD